MAQTNTTTTVTTTTSTQQGTKLVVESQSNTITVGNFVTDVSIQPYIANRIISFFAYNMRPNQRMHIFFDSVLVDDYCAPAKIPTSIPNTSDYNSIEKNGNWGDAIYSDADGMVAAQFNIPAGKFKTGDRILQICDVTSLAQGSDAYTTIASAIFTASNLNVTKQLVTLTTVNPSVSVVPVVNTVVTSSTNVSISIIPDFINVQANWTEPIAQALTINTPRDQTGIFATAIDVYFKQKSQVNNRGVTLYLCEMVNGYPNGKAILPFSTVHKNYADINVSDDGSVATKFTFESPVFLNNNTEYAFIVKPDANDPDYFVFSANLGDIDLQTGYQVFSQPAVGTAFYGATMNEWTAVQTEYIKFKLYRANFSNGSGTAIFNNSNTDYVSVYNIGYNNTSVGILPGDYVYQSTNSTTNSTGGTVNTSIYGILNYFDDIKGIMYLEYSTGNFTPNTFVQVHRFANASVTTPNNTTFVAYANTGSLYNPGVDAIVPQFATLIPSGTSLTYGYKGTSNTYNTDSDYFKIIPGYETEFYDQERIVASKTNENSYMSGNKSLSMRANFTTDSEFISPVIDTVRHQELVIKNDIDPVGFKYNEYFNSGNTKSKYVSKIVTLADGQDAEDIQIILTAFKPIGSNIQVWIKFLSGEDPEDISQKTWTPLVNDSYNVYSDPSNPSDFRELSFSTGAYYKLTSTTGGITASNSSTTVTGTSTLFQTELEPGWYINMKANSTFNEVTRKVVSIASNTSLTLDSPFNGNYSNVAYYIVPPPTTAWVSTNTAVQLTGTVTTYTTNNAIVGSSTNFTGELTPGSIISVAGDNQKVVSITNSTSLSVGKPWSAAVAGANAYNISPAGVSYLNNNISLFTTFKRFQIKIILQSDDSSKVPIIDDLRVLALQL